LATDHSTPIGKLVEGASKRHEPAREQNPTCERDGRDDITRSVKLWILMPVTLFQIAVFGVLLFMLWAFLSDWYEPPDYAWPVLIGAFAGVPIGLAANVKKLLDAVISGTG